MKRIFSLFLAILLIATFVPFSSVEAEAFMKPTFTEYKVTFDPGSGTGRATSSSYQSIETSVILPSASSVGFSHEDKNYVFDGWTISGKTYGAGDTYTFTTATASRNSEDQYTVYATAKWKRSGSSSGSSSSSSGSSGSSSSSSSTAETVTIIYTPGDAEGSAYSKTYTKGQQFSLISNPYKYDGYTFEGWLIKGYESQGVLPAGQRVSLHESVTAVAQWKPDNTGIEVIDPNDPGSSSASSSKPASSQPSSSKPASSQPASSKPASSASSSKSSSSSSSESSSSSSSSMSESSSSSSSVPETPVVDVFEPISLAYSINGDIPVTGIEFLLKEDIGESPQLQLAALDGYSVTDPAAAGFIASGDALAAFDLSLVAAGASYKGSAEGTVTFNLNGTQADAESNYKNYVLAMVHTTSFSTYTGQYYMTDGENVYFYDPATAFKTAVTNVGFVEENGCNRLVIRDTAGLNSFAYLADANTIVEVSLVPGVNTTTASIDVSSLSPILLVHIEVGEGKSAGGGIPFWVWIIIAVIVLLIIALVVLYLINRKNEQKRLEARRERESSAPRRTSYSSNITGFDDD